MLELTSAGRPASLSPGTSVQVEYHSPLFDEDTLKGQFSYSFALPAGPNGPLYGWPELADRLLEPGEALPAELAYQGLPLLTGVQRVTAATAAKYTLSVQGGLSGAGLSERQLASFSYGGLREVPRWQLTSDGNGDPIQVPGLLLHANEVVADPGSYDYVFAPLRNEYRPPLPAGSPPYQAVSPLLYPDNTVNAWSVAEGNLFGMPAGGSFSYHTFFQVPGTPLATSFTLLPPYCPFPRLRYVLRAIFEECGLAVDLARLLPGELGELVVVTNAQLVDRGDGNTLRFSLADVLPALTVAELLAALRQDLGLVVYLDAHTRRVRSARLSERVVPQVGDVDLTPFLAGTPELSVGSAPAGLTLTYGLDAADELTQDLLDQQPAPSLVRPAVATVADLPATADLFTDNPQAGQVRLVVDTGTYYACTLGYRDATSVYLTWSWAGLALPPVPVNGGGAAQAQTLCYTVERPTTLNTVGDVARVPAISQPPYRADQATVERSRALRLLFYNGLQRAQPVVGRPAASAGTYPQLSHQSASGALSVRLGGLTGTYVQLLSAWLPVRRRPASYKLALALPALELARLDLTRPVHVAGVPYLVRQLAATLPLRKPATLELVRL